MGCVTVAARRDSKGPDATEEEEKEEEEEEAVVEADVSVKDDNEA